jgi:hypothetical protein
MTAKLGPPKQAHGMTRFTTYKRGETRGGTKSYFPQPHPGYAAPVALCLFVHVHARAS